MMRRTSCAAAILAAVPQPDRDGIASGTVEDWSREGWEAARRHAYATLVGDPCGPKPDVRPALTEDKVRALIPIVRRQVLAGGLRLARLLDDALEPETRAPGR